MGLTARSMRNGMSMQGCPMMHGGMGRMQGHGSDSSAMRQHQH